MWKMTHRNVKSLITSQAVGLSGPHTLDYFTRLFLELTGNLNHKGEHTDI